YPLCALLFAVYRESDALCQERQIRCLLTALDLLLRHMSEHFHQPPVVWPNFALGRKHLVVCTIQLVFAQHGVAKMLRIAEQAALAGFGLWIYLLEAHSVTSSLTTTNFFKFADPNAVVSATSAASRPVAISTRPIRGTLCRASIVHQRPPRYTSNHALKSIGAGGT